MKLSQLHLKSFRSFVDTSLSLEAPRILVGGLLGTGKSTIREGIRWALTGKAADWTGATVENASLAPQAIPDIASVRLLVDGLGWIERTWRASGSELRVQGFTGNSGSQQQALYDKFRVSEPYVQAACDSGVFLRLHHAEAKALLLGLLNVQIVVKDQTYTLDQLEAAYQLDYAERRAKKAQQKTCLVPPKPEGEFAPIETIEGKLNGLRDQMAEKRQQIGTVQGQRKQLFAQFPVGYPVLTCTWNGTPEELDAQIADAEERLAIMEADTVVEPPPTLQAAFSATDIEGISRRILSLQGHQPTKGCVIDPNVPCQTHKSKFTNRAKDLQAKLKTDDDKAIQQHVAPSPQNPLTALRHDLEHLRSERLRFDQDQQAVQAAIARRKRLDAEAEALPDVTSVEAEIVTLQGRIQNGEAMLKAAQAHQHALQAHLDGLQRRQALAVEIAALEASCEALGPTGARVPALQAALDPFLARVNAFTGSFGWAVSLSIEPWDVVVNGRSITTYSKSQQYRIGIALQIAITHLSGVGFVIVDELDMLDLATRREVGTMLAASGIPQVIMLATREPDVPLPAQGPELRAYRLGLVKDRSTILEGSPA